MSPSWKPRRKGEIYCSPACGANCKKADYDSAKKESKELANAFGSKWKPHIWENFGWHWSIVSAKIELYANKINGVIKSYHVSFDEGRWNGSGESPKDAVRNALDDAKETLYEVERVVKAAEEILR